MNRSKTNTFENADSYDQSRSEAPSMTLMLGRIMLKILLQFVFMAAVLFASAGTLRWTRAWIYLAVALAGLAVNAAFVLRRNPEAVIERHKKRENTKPADKAITRIISMFFIAMWIVAGLDSARFGWTSMPRETVYPGIVIYLLGMAVTGWCMASNPFLEKSVRIQSDRGQQVITAGPYAFVRHPMYAGMIAMLMGCALIVGSVWALIPAVINIALFVLRTAYEDATLRRELAGYEDYTAMTRHRLLPGIW